jgi:hypothetical protein
VLAKFLYWLAVLIVSVAILVGLVLFLESRDESSLDGARARLLFAAQAGATSSSFANATIRSVAL